MSYSLGSITLVNVLWILEKNEVNTVPTSNTYSTLCPVILKSQLYTTVAIIPISTRSTRKLRLSLVNNMLPEPNTKTTDVCINVYKAFIPNRHGVTIVLLITD